MKTIEKASMEAISDRTISVEELFRVGVEFAQRWIPVDGEEHMDVGMDVLVKDIDDNLSVFEHIDEYDILTIKKYWEYWKPIEYK